MVNVRSKGQRGEREASDLVQSWLEPVTAALGIEPIVLKRNLQQTQEGGYDLVGIDWLALEVKRQENLKLGSWWTQTVKQAKPGQTPFLMYKQNRVPWKFRVGIIGAHTGSLGIGTSALTVDMDMDNACLWLRSEFWHRNQR